MRFSYTLLVLRGKGVNTRMYVHPRKQTNGSRMLYYFTIHNDLNITLYLRLSYPCVADALLGFGKSIFILLIELAPISVDPFSASFAIRTLGGRLMTLI